MPLSSTAAPLTIASYDVTDTPLSGFGCWSHTYSGTITLTNRTVIGCGNDPPVPVANYTGGGGSLNDGVIASSVNGSQLFTLTSYDGGPPLSPTITLHLATPGTVNRIQIYGGDPANAIPGGIDGVTVEIGGVAIVFATTPFGALNALGVPVNDEIDVSGSALAGVLTDLIVLRDFTGALAFSSAISITEITVASLPEPATLALLAVGFAAFATRRRPERNSLKRVLTCFMAPATAAR